MTNEQLGKHILKHPNSASCHGPTCDSQLRGWERHNTCIYYIYFKSNATKIVFTSFFLLLLVLVPN